MNLSEIQVQNFRNIDSLTVKLSPGLNVIVGENNVGKTNLLDAVRLALGSASASGEPVRLFKEDLHRGRDGKTKSTTIRVDLVFAALTPEEQGQFIDLLNYDATEPKNSTASIHFECSWNESLKRWQFRRWAGARPNAEAVVPEDALQSLPLTLLGALRDALSALVPGRQSRLGRLLSISAAESDKTSLVTIVKAANDALQQQQLVRNVESRILRALQGASGPNLSQEAAIQAFEPEFDRIVNNLRLVLKVRGILNENNAPLFEEVRANGLGYNNLLYIATVLAELKASTQATLPLLLVEEPEAHLHPQLQTLLADFLAKGASEGEENSNVQTIVTTHSPTITAYVPPSRIRVLHRPTSGDLRCVSLSACGFDEREMNQLRRMFDVTKATLLFAKGVVLVEGTTEAILLPVLARRLGMPLEQKALSVIPVCGVDFGTIGKLFGNDKLSLPVAIVTDGDAEIVYNPSSKEQDWTAALPRKDADGQLEVCDRVLALQQEFKANPVVRVCPSQVTLEYDLADAGSKNPDIMCQAWESCFLRSSRTFNSEKLAECGADHNRRVLAVWRGICLAETTRGKGEFAQALAEALEARDEAGKLKIPPDGFSVPKYLQNAVSFVWGSV